jgi:hypothetical protein
MTHTVFLAETIDICSVLGDNEGVSSIACYNSRVFLGTDSGFVKCMVISEANSGAKGTLKTSVDLKTLEPVAQIEVDAELSQIFTLSKGKLGIYDMSHLCGLGMLRTENHTKSKFWIGN